MMWRRRLFAGLLLTAALALGFLLAVLTRPTSRHDFPIRENNGRLTNPLLDFEIEEYSELKVLEPLGKEMDGLVSRFKEEGVVDDVAVYVRDLNTGVWTGVRESEDFIPGSLIKVPLVVACLLQAQRQPGFLDRRVTFTGMPSRLGQVHFAPAVALEVGGEYAVLDLIGRTARYSDNASTFLLYGVVDPEILREVFGDLGIDPDRMLSERSAFSPRDFCRYFRLLYNASYLSRGMSEAALEMFAQSEFRAGLVAGLPGEIRVAHKFGEFLEGEGEQRRVLLHDCGIVYLPGRPYVMCVMTRGRDYDQLGRVIASVSSLVYSGLQAMKPTD